MSRPESISLIEAHERYLDLISTTDELGNRQFNEMVPRAGIAGEIGRFTIAQAGFNVEQLQCARYGGEVVPIPVDQLTPDAFIATLARTTKHPLCLTLTNTGDITGYPHITISEFLLAPPDEVSASTKFMDKQFGTLNTGCDPKLQMIQIGVARALLGSEQAVQRIEKIKQLRISFTETIATVVAGSKFEETAILGLKQAVLK